MDFLRRIADSSPLPAGGAAAAYTLALAVGLLHKIILLEIHRRADQPEMEKKLLNAKKEIDTLLKDVELLVEQDVAAFKRFSRSLRAGGKGQMEIDCVGINEVSMKILHSSEAALERIRQLHRIVPKWMLVNLMVAAELIAGAVNASVHLVRTNLQSFRSDQKRSDYMKRSADLQKDYRAKHEIVLAELLQEQQWMQRSR
jgi:formiminotetrahydrofolate cyclodeaminase